MSTKRITLKAQRVAGSARTGAAAMSMAQRSKARKGKSLMLRETAPMIPRGFVGARGDAKYLDTAAATYVCNTTGTVTHLNPVPRGDSVNTRNGRAYRCTSINVRGTVASDTTTIFNMYAIYLVWDYQPNKALAAITDVLESASSFAFPKRENNARFKIVKKWVGTNIGNSTTPATGDESIVIDEYIKLPKDANTLLTSADSTGVIGDMLLGALLLVTVGQQAAGTADTNAILGFRLNFTEDLS